MCRPTWILAVLSAIALLSRTAAATTQFDVIYASSIDVKFSPGVVGYTFGAISYVLLVNTGTVPIAADEITQSSFTCTGASLPGFKFIPFMAHLSSYAPIACNEAVGGVKSGRNDTLLSQLRPGEVFRNTTPVQVLALEFGVPYPPGDFAGIVLFDVAMRVGGQQVSFQTQVTVTQGVSSPSVTVTGASRVSSTATVAAQPLTWGKLKALYR